MFCDNAVPVDFMARRRAEAISLGELIINITDLIV